ncbi:PH domain-containing protein [Dietzia alimentaria]|uniref:PH domain-containing protein n=1 Tax=Dietzia alimentaria TaxID=665550 RepID=UPI00029A87DF|nr:PH domain-containing protein [Dietzia alimentaria]
MISPPPHEWARLDRRTVAASTVLTSGALAAAAIPVTIGMLLSGLAIGWVVLWTIGGVLLGIVATAVSETIRLAATSFRVDAHRIERRVRFLSSTTTSLSTGRVRNVEITADPVQRRMGIATVRLASGETDGSRLTLAALDLEAAEELRRRLVPTHAESGTSQIARLDPRWIRYAPASITTPLLGLAAIGALAQVANWFDAVPATATWIWERIDSLPLAAILLGAAGVGIAGRSGDGGSGRGEPVGHAPRAPRGRLTGDATRTDRGPAHVVRRAPRARGDPARTAGPARSGRRTARRGGGGRGRRQRRQGKNQPEPRARARLTSRGFGARS